MMMSSVQQRTPTKRTRPENKKQNKHYSSTKPVKVVYISNPMKINTSASEFRALVQELTGQDAESPPDPSRFQEQMEEKINGHDDVIIDGVVVPSPPLDPNYQGHPSNSFESFEPFDDGVFTPQMLENISNLLPPSVFYDPHLGW